MILMPDSHHIATNITSRRDATVQWRVSQTKSRLSELAPITTREQVILAPGDKGDIY
jgi:hypothetical protein